MNLNVTRKPDFSSKQLFFRRFFPISGRKAEKKPDFFRFRTWKIKKEMYFTWHEQYMIDVCGCSSMVEPQPSKLIVRVRFPSPAPISGSGGVPERPKGADCKSAVADFDGSNPSPTTIQNFQPSSGRLFYCPDTCFERKKTLLRIVLSLMDCLMKRHGGGA